MQRKWMPLTAGILEIVSGSFSVFICLIAGVIMLSFGLAGEIASAWTSRMPMMSVAALMLIATPFFLMGILAIIGGIFAIKGRHWGWALAGAIAATLHLWWLLGAAAIVFVVLGRHEFI